MTQNIQQNDLFIQVDNTDVFRFWMTEPEVLTDKSQFQMLSLPEQIAVFDCVSECRCAIVVFADSVSIVGVEDSNRNYDHLFDEIGGLYTYEALKLQIQIELMQNIIHFI